MPLQLTEVGYQALDDQDNVLGSISYDRETNQVTIIKGDNVDSLTIPATHIDTIRSLLKEVKEKISEVFE